MNQPWMYIHFHLPARSGFCLTKVLVAFFCELMGTLHAFSCLTSLQHLTHGPLLPSSSCLLSGFLSFISFPFFSLLISLWLFLLLWYKHGCSLSFPAHFPSLDSPKEILSIAGASVTKWMPLTDSQIPISSLDIFCTLVLCILFFFFLVRIFDQ